MLIHIHYLILLKNKKISNIYNIRIYIIYIKFLQIIGLIFLFLKKQNNSHFYPLPYFFFFFFFTPLLTETVRDTLINSMTKNHNTSCRYY